MNSANSAALPAPASALRYALKSSIVPPSLHLYINSLVKTVQNFIPFIFLKKGVEDYNYLVIIGV